MNWGNKILIGITVFVTGISSMVYVAMKQTNEVVDEKYYESELKFQEKIDASKNLANLSEPLVITNNKDVFTIQFPKAAVDNNAKGKIELLNALQNSSDVSVNVKAVNGIQSIDKNRLAKGTYFLKVDWTNSGVAYYHQQNINIQ
jgi:hypothetical protein